jgi:hypothetical protein
METDKVIRGLAAKVDQMTTAMFQVLTAIQDVQQRQKVIQYTISKGVDTDVHVPKGEVDTVLCEECGARMHVSDTMKQVKHVGDKVLTFTVCRKCFYGKRK